VTTKERPARILAVDDDAQIRRALSVIVRSRGYALELAVNGADAIAKAVDRPPDLLILDLSLPDRSGIDVCRELRSWMTAPILVLSVLSGDTDKIASLDAGADDYLTKPFSAGELLARVRALLRRTREAVTPPPIVTILDLVVDIGRRRVTLAGHDLSGLTPTEFEILLYLARNAGLVVTQRQLLDHVWGPHSTESAAALRVHVSNLRKKIEPVRGTPRYIFTEPGVGFRFASPKEGAAPRAGRLPRGHFVEARRAGGEY
jgi:two-component system KDP operon response regulator KdpE